MEIPKLATFLANEHQNDQKNDTNDFVYIFAMNLFTQKRLCQWNARKCCIKADFNQNGSHNFS